MGLGFALLFFAYDRFAALIAAILRGIGWGPDKGFDQAIAGIVRLASWLTGWMQNGKLETYLNVVFVVLAASLLIPLWMHGELPSWPAWPDFYVYEWIIILIAAIGAIAVAVARNRLMGVVALGIQGFAGAPKIR